MCMLLRSIAVARERDDLTCAADHNVCWNHPLVRGRHNRSWVSTLESDKASGSTPIQLYWVPGIESFRQHAKYTVTDLLLRERGLWDEEKAASPGYLHCNVAGSSVSPF